MAEKRAPTLAEIICAGAIDASADVKGHIIRNTREARRFTLDDDAVAAISEIRRDFMSVPILEYARSPFPDAGVWIEYNHHARLKGSGTPVAYGHSELSGFMVRDNGDGTISARGCWSIDGRAFLPGFFFSYSHTGAPLWDMSIDEHQMREMQAVTLLGVVDRAYPKTVSPAVSALTRHVLIHWDAGFGGEPNSPERAMALEILREAAGDLGFLTAALAMINHGLVGYRDRPRPPGQRVLNGKLRPYMSDSVVSIAIPGKLSPIEALKRAHRAEQTRKRAHEVRGHFRHYRDGRVVWIRSHQRGDASLGFVRQRYEVVAAQ